MRIDTSVQGSIEWHAARAGCITASNFHLVRASARLKSGPNKGDYSKEARRYAFRLGIERISRLPLSIDDGFEVWQAERGHRLEPHARFRHERLSSILVEEAGFISTDDGHFGASADGFADLYGRRVGCEYKAFLDPSKLEDILLRGEVESVLDQIEGGIWVTGLDGWHFGLYCPALESIGLDFTLIPIERDQERIDALEADLWKFDCAVEEVVARLRQRAGMNEPTPTTPASTWEAAAVNKELARVATELTELPLDLFA